MTYISKDSEVLYQSKNGREEMIFIEVEASAKFSHVFLAKGN